MGDDNTVVHFRKPIIQFSMRENLLVVTGTPESKQLKDMLPEIIKQVGPQQYEALKNLMGDFAKQPRQEVCRRRRRRRAPTRRNLRGRRQEMNRAKTMSRDYGALRSGLEARTEPAI